VGDFDHDDVTGSTVVAGPRDVLDG